MPFVNRRVEPLYLSNKALPSGCSTELENVANNSLANLVRQLADIAGHATSIFDGICAEARDIHDRSCRLRTRTDSLSEYLQTLDARAVEVPVSTLSDFKSLTDHYRYRSSVQENLITQASRPQCIELQYRKASTDLKDIFEKLKEYHEDTVTVSNLCQSISLSRLNCDTDSSEYDIEFPRRRRKPLLPYSKLPARPLSEGDLLDDYVPPNRGTLPTPEELMRRNVTLSTVVDVDTSGTGFERMQMFRRSLTAMGRKLEKAKKKRWRRTISGIPDNVRAELQTESAGEADDGRSTDRENEDMQSLKTMSLDRRTFSQVKPVESPAVGIAVVTPIRTRRRPKSLRLPGPIIFPGLQQWRENHQAKQEKKQEAKAGSRDRHSVALPAQTAVPTPSPSQGYSSCSDDKAWPGPSQRRPQSLALPPSSIPQSLAPLALLSPAQLAGKKVYVTSNRTVPNAVIPTSSVTMTISTCKTSSGSRDSQDGLPLNELQTGLPSTKVRLRTAKPTVKREERQSSSGNWSGTDSARTSMNSDLGSAMNCDFLGSTTTSPSDSAVSLSSENISFPKFSGGLKSLDRKHSRGKSDQPSGHLYTSAGESSSESSTPTNSPNVGRSGFTQMDTDSWLQSVGAATERRMPPEAGNVAPARKSPKGQQCEVIFTSDALSDSSSSSENPASSSALSDNGSIDLDACLADINSDFIDSDSTSGHSVDHEGYWTSMHSDCGLPYRRTKKRKSSPSKEPLPVNLRIGPPAVQPKPKRISLVVAAPVVPSSTYQKKAPPLPPIRVDSVSSGQSLNTQQNDQTQNEVGHKSSSLLPPLSFQDDNRSVSPSSLTDTASEASTISSDTTTTPTLTPVQTPTDPALYKLCFGGSSKSLESLDSQLSGSQGNGPTSRVDAWTAEVSESFHFGQEPTRFGTPTLNATTSSCVLAPPVQEQASVAKFRPQLIQPSSSVLPRVSQAQPLVFPQPAVVPNSPTHEGKMKMLNARDKFFGISRTTNTNSGAVASDTANGTADGNEQTLPDEVLESEEIVSPIGVYPEKYNTLKRRPKHEADASKKAAAKKTQDLSNSLVVSDVSADDVFDEQSEVCAPEGKTVASQAKKGLDTLQRKRFQEYVSNVQSQAPQNYNSINSLKESAPGNGTQAMTREQREEILNMLRRTKNSKVVNSPSLPEPSLKKWDDPPRHELGKIHENVTVQEPALQQEEETSEKASFRSSYYDSVESENLDPDLAIIRAAEQMEKQLRLQRQSPNAPVMSSPSEPDDNVWLPNSQPFSRNSIAYRSIYDSEMCGNSFSHIPSMDMDNSYVYDPNLKPKSSILKVRKQGDTSRSETKSNGMKHHSSTLSGGHGQATMSPTDSVSSLNSIRSITFSDTLDVERTPVKVCPLSGKPQTPMDDFKMLLQQHSGPRRGQSACSALNVQPKSPRTPSTAELLYSGSRAGTIQEEGTKVQDRKIVTMKDLRTAMANPRTNSRTGDLGLPYEELQAQNRQRSPKNSPTASPNSTLTKQDKGVRFDFEQVQDMTSDTNASKSLDTGRVESLPNGNVNDLTQDDQSRQSLKVGGNENGKVSSQRNLGLLPEQTNKRVVLNHSSASDPGEIPSSKVNAVKSGSESVVPGDNIPISQANKAKSIKSPPDLTSRFMPHLTESASDSILSRKDLMDEIRRRGGAGQQGSRQEAVAALEMQQLQRKLSTSSLPSLTTAGAGPTPGGSKALGSLLDSMKTALKSMEVASPAVEGEHENDSSAWE
ncbi:Nance-Horan syndrome protein-like isoform X2 [Acanthaster planci]|uniref:Nance-Horan syndrome protein-like isoform X2 n=1 Tax=Acanthaster planci TaxID=133434 RepID=A0A8B7ZQ89_ACAPL|nr:Nance-Horan syndrome protein-like isoform X2 [Acanthaster planci]